VSCRVSASAIVATGSDGGGGGVRAIFGVGPFSSESLLQRMQYNTELRMEDKRIVQIAVATIQEVSFVEIAMEVRTELLLRLLRSKNPNNFS